MPAVSTSRGLPMAGVGIYIPSEVRFAGSENYSSLQTITSDGATSHSDQSQWSNYSRQQVYKKVTDWFTVWQPWQQRMLLCGLTNRCSTKQLESLASTLEPIFHRDFATFLCKRYPSAPFKKHKRHPVTEKSKHDKKVDIETFVQKLLEEIVNSVCCDEKTGVENVRTDEEVDKSELAQSGDTIKEELIIVHHDTNKSEVQRYISIENNGVPTAIQEETLEPGINLESADGEKQILESKESEQIKTTEEESTLHREVSEDGRDGEISEDGGGIICCEDINEEEQKERESGCREDINEEEEERESGWNGSIENRKEEMQEEERTFDKQPHKYEGPRKIVISRPFLSSFQYAPKLEPVKGLRGPRRVKDNLGLLLAREVSSVTNQPLTRQSYPPAAGSSHHGQRVHRHRSGITTADVRMTDFFDHRKLAKLGPMQTQLRTGSVHRPPRITDIDTPVQQMYKNVKLWGSEPRHGRMFVRPKKSHLKHHFKEQVKRVWQWMSEWEEFERLNLLVDIVKCCDPDLLNYFAQCLIERLHERIDISWLSDPLLLLIFSYLSPADIASCSRVCRRWRYLSSVNELWMIKCQEHGLDQGIPNLLDLVKNAEKTGQSVDWRLAYMELQTITEEAKACLPIPSRLAFQGSTPCGMRRVCGKFIAVSEPGNQTPRSLLLGSQHSLATTISADLHDTVDGETLTSRRPITLFIAKPGETLEEEEVSPQVGVPVKSIGEPPSPKPVDSIVNTEQVGGQRSVEVTQDKTALRISKQREKDSQEKEGPQRQEDQRTPSQGPVLQPSGQKKGMKEEEVAVDVRPQLVQSRDILHPGGKLALGPWSEEEVKEAREMLEAVAGKVSPIKKVRKLQGHMDAVLCVECDARRLISGSMDRTIRVWDVRSGRSLHKLYGHKGGVTCLKFDNETLYSGSWDTAVMVWNLVSFERLTVLSGHNGSVSCLALNDTHLLSGSHDATIRVWDRRTNLCKRVLRGHRSHILAMALDGPLVITTSSDRTMQITDYKTEVRLHMLRTQYAVSTLLVSGTLIMTGNTQGHLYLWNKETGEHEVGIEAHDNALITRVCYLSGHIYTASSDGTIKEWDMMTMACIRTLQGHKGPVKDLKVSSRGLVSAGTDGHIRVWHTKTPRNTLHDDDDDNIRMTVVNHRNGPP